MTKTNGVGMEKRPEPIRRALQARQAISPKEMVTWVDDGGTEVGLNAGLVQYLFKSKYPITDREALLFIQQAKARRANPFTGDIYLVKYSASDPAQIVTGYHYFMRKVKENADYRGYSLWYVDKEGKRIADGLETPESVVAAVALVRIAGYEEPVKFVARMKDYNKHQALWNNMAVVMLGKCAIGNAHRLADPGLGRLYLPEEVGQGYIASEDPPVDAEFTEEGPTTEGPEMPAPPADAAPAPETTPQEPAAPSSDESLTIEALCKSLEKRLPKPAERLAFARGWCDGHSVSPVPRNLDQIKVLGVDALNWMLDALKLQEA